MVGVSGTDKAERIRPWSWLLLWSVTVSTEPVSGLFPVQSADKSNESWENGFDPQAGQKYTLKAGQLKKKKKKLQELQGLIKGQTKTPFRNDEVHMLMVYN